MKKINFNFNFGQLPYAIYHKQLGFHSQMLKSVEEFTELNNKLLHLIQLKNPMILFRKKCIIRYF